MSRWSSAAVGTKCSAPTRASADSAMVHLPGLYRPPTDCCRLLGESATSLPRSCPPTCHPGNLQRSAVRATRKVLAMTLRHVQSGASLKFFAPGTTFHRAMIITDQLGQPYNPLWTLSGCRHACGAGCQASSGDADSLSSLSSMSTEDACTLLGVGSNAGFEEVLQAKRRLLKPDDKPSKQRVNEVCTRPDMQPARFHV